ncbi:RelA/SpoT family protein [Patescibacteria group bacterium]
MQREFSNFLKRVKDYNSSISEQNLATAFAFANEAYEGHSRFSGDPVISHTLETAKILSTLKVDEETLIAALLHEVPQYTDFKIKDIEKKFGKNVSLLVSAFERIGTVRSSVKGAELETLRKMFLVMAKDLRVVLIKLADRLHNLQTLEYVKPEKRKRIARETLEIYVPIASRLGVYHIRSTLEDLCFKNLNNSEYKNIQEQLKLLGKKRKNVVDDITLAAEDYLKENGYDARVAGRFKNTYSIYKKLKKKGKTSIDEIHDIFALRIILPSKFEKGGKEKVDDLYRLIGHIHTNWKPLPGRFKDYIGFPKPNGYRSLHTTVIGLAPHSVKEPVEIQVRTDKMHEEAEYGIASHWLYKESNGNSQDRQKAHLEWITNLTKVSSHFENEDDEEVLNDLKVDLFQDRIFVFTPDGEVLDLPVGSTPIDFAYAIHTDVGHKCTMAKANGSIIPLHHELQNGEVIEILTRNNVEPKLEWLAFAKTSGARTKIKSYFRSFDKEDNLREGRELINAKLTQIGKPILDPKMSLFRNIDGKALSYKEREELVRQVGNGSMLPSSAISKVFSYDEIIGKKKVKKVAPSKIVDIKKESEIGKYVVAGGEKGLPVKRAQCCKPGFGQPIAGYVTRGRAISIHKKGCKILKMSNEDRYINAHWVGTLEDEMLRQVSLYVETAPNTYVMRDVTKEIEKSKGSILQFYIKKETQRSFLWELLVEISDFNQFEKILSSIERTAGVQSVKKVT